MNINADDWILIDEISSYSIDTPIVYNYGFSKERYAYGYVGDLLGNEDVITQFNITKFRTKFNVHQYYGYFDW